MLTILLLVALTVLLSPAEAFSTNGNQIVNLQGQNIRITGVNWFGFETATRSPHGLCVHSYKWFLEKAKELGFNTLRIPFCNEMMRPGFESVPFGETPYKVSLQLNPELAGMTALEIMDEIIRYCGEINLMVFIDRHSAKPDNFWLEDIWYIPGDAYYTERRWIDDWVFLADRYKNSPNVIGADLFNEPKNTADWTQWNLAAERCGNAIHVANPNWLIIVEGTQSYQGTTNWWGGNLKGVQDDAVVLTVPNKVVYSIHDYPSSVYPQPWFDAANYPNNLDEHWRSFWGYLFEQNTAPILIGEFGTFLETESDRQWLDKLTDYMDGDYLLDGTNQLAAGKKGMSFTWWCFNPDSGDTGGILQDDWTTVNTDKIAYLTFATNDPDPTADPTLAPSANPTAKPTVPPTAMPSADPTAVPNAFPSAIPTMTPTTTPSTATPTMTPTVVPTADPTAVPFGPTMAPSASPTNPTTSPSTDPSADPSTDPSTNPSTDPSAVPSINPSADPSADPSANPSADLTANPSADPSANPSANPSVNPSAVPTTDSTKDPSTVPTVSPTNGANDCLGPFPGYQNCEKKIQWALGKRDSAWYVSQGLDGSRCSIQGYYNDMGGHCPAPHAPSTDAPVVAPSGDDCLGPFPGYNKCERKIQWALGKRDSAWYVSQGLDGSRCSIQGYYNSHGGHCPVQ